LSGFALRDGTGKPSPGALGPVLRAVPVAAGSRDAAVESADVLGPDPALVRAIGDRAYEISVQPIAPNHFVQLVTTYAMPATPRAGALRLVVPGRDTAGDCRGSLHIAPGPG